MQDGRDDLCKCLLRDLDAAGEHGTLENGMNDDFQNRAAVGIIKEDFEVFRLQAEGEAAAYKAGIHG